MKLVSFSVKNYRSITTARKIPLSNYSLLIGANNEGKSNILHALALAMNTLVGWQHEFRRSVDGRLIRAPRRSYSKRYGRSSYDWDTDFPVRKQKKWKSNGVSTVLLEFELNESEVREFRSEIRSNLNGTLPLEVSFGHKQVDVTVKKPGKGGISLTKKSNRVAEFISKRIRFEYIPAIRTAESAGEVVYQLVEHELYELEDNEEYTNALAKIEELQKPVFDALADTIQSTVSSFLPSVKSVQLESRREARYRALRRDVEVVIDDGSSTRLERKGDGVQSLVALALMRHASQKDAAGLSKVIAIEEPESHLHPKAIHELRSVIESLSEQNQVVLTSHSPLFVNPNDLTNTIIVKGNRARCASQVSDVRDALGVRFSDNLQNSRLVLLVEGSNDINSLKSILSSRSPKLKAAFRNGTVVFDELGGASGLRQKASFYRSGACMIQCMLDNDADGQVAARKAIDDKILKTADINLCSVPHLRESELEDLFDRNAYRVEFEKEFGVDPSVRNQGNKKKWSTAMGNIFIKAGKHWDDELKRNVKRWLAEYAVVNPEIILHEQLSGPVCNFMHIAERKISGLY